MRKLTAQKCVESHASEKLTLGSETSQYQEEKRLISISLVAASERGGAQTRDTRFCPAVKRDRI